MVLNYNKPRKLNVFDKDLTYRKSYTKKKKNVLNTSTLIEYKKHLSILLAYSQSANAKFIPIMSYQ